MIVRIRSLHALSRSYHLKLLPISCVYFQGQLTAYSTPMRRRTWHPASQPSIALNFLDSIRFTFLSAFKRKQCNAQVLYPECAVEPYLSKSARIFKFPATHVLKSLEIPAWSFFGNIFFGVREYCTVAIVPWILYRGYWTASPKSVVYNAQLSAAL